MVDVGAYGARLAEDYDAIYDGVWETGAAVDALVRLAGPGAVLELGVGTGRIALPLVARGVTVAGVDGSQDMLDRLAAKPLGDRVRTVCGDFGSTTVPGSFEVVALLVNTLFAMPDQAAQVACFQTAARHLSPGGRFVVEAWVPDPPRGSGVALKARRLGSGYAGLVVEDHDAAGQRLMTRQIVIGEDGRTLSFPVVHRYAWPSEMDLMAQLAGLTLESRWGDWRGAPFTAASENHVSVWMKERARV